MWDEDAYGGSVPGGCCVCFVNDTATTEIYTLSLHDALPIYTSIASFNWSALVYCLIRFSICPRSMLSFCTVLFLRTIFALGWPSIVISSSDAGSELWLIMLRSILLTMIILRFALSFVFFAYWTVTLSS